MELTFKSSIMAGVSVLGWSQRTEAGSVLRDRAENGPAANVKGTDLVLCSGGLGMGDGGSQGCKEGEAAHKDECCVEFHLCCGCQSIDTDFIVFISGLFYPFRNYFAGMKRIWYM